MITIRTNNVAAAIGPQTATLRIGGLVGTAGRAVRDDCRSSAPWFILLFLLFRRVPASRTLRLRRKRILFCVAGYKRPAQKTKWRKWQRPNRRLPPGRAARFV